MRVAVVGGTGLVGEQVVSALTERGHETVVLARSTGVDVSTGAGLADALAGAEAVVDVSNIQTAKTSRAVAFFEAATGHLLQAERAAGIRHHVLLSIVGIDAATSGYYAGKVRQESIVTEGDVPFTILRATQFHEFAGQMLERATFGPFALVPKMTVQPVAAATVGAALADLATAAPAGRVSDLAGPEVHELVELARRVVAVHGPKVRVLGVPLPGKAGRAMRDGQCLPGLGARIEGPTFAQWLHPV